MPPRLAISGQVCDPWGAFSIAQGLFFADSFLVDATLPSLDAHFDGPSLTTRTTGRRVMKTGEILAISGNWLDLFEDHSGKEPHCVVVKRGKNAALSGGSWPSGKRHFHSRVRGDRQAGARPTVAPDHSLNAYGQRSVVKSTKQNQAWVKLLGPPLEAARLQLPSGVSAHGGCNPPSAIP